MDIQQILKVLKNERECIARQSRPLGEMPQCRKDDDGVKLCEYCDLCLPDDEILEVYDFLINGYELLQNEGAESYSIRCDTSKLSQEEIDDFISKLKQAPNNLYVRCEPIEAEIKPLPPDVITKILGQEGTD